MGELVLGNKKILPFTKRFAHDLAQHVRKIASLEAAKIDDEQLNLSAVRDELSVSIAWLVENKAKLVSGTKALHHVLPNLVVPMDRKYTQVFFGWQNPHYPSIGQRECFLLEAFEAFACLARVVQAGSICRPGLALFSKRNYWTTRSLP